MTYNPHCCDTEYKWEFCIVGRTSYWLLRQKYYGGVNTFSYLVQDGSSVNMTFDPNLSKSSLALWQFKDQGNGSYEILDAAGTHRLEFHDSYPTFQWQNDHIQVPRLVPLTNDTQGQSHIWHFA
jgi:hypothetical protein